jgi:hypothetical protein
VHFGDDIVVVHVRGFLEEGHTVNVEGRLLETKLIIPIVTCSVTRH